MATPIILKITEAGKQAALSATGAGVQIAVNLSSVAIGSSRYTPTGSETSLKKEVSRVSIVSGTVEQDNHTLRFGSTVTTRIITPVYELGVYTDTGVLFAVAASAGSPLFTVHPDITFVGAFAITLDSMSAENVTVITDPNSGLAPVVMDQHVAAKNPHPQYLNVSHLDVSTDPHPQYLELSRFQLLLDILIPVGYLHHTHAAANPKAKFDELLGINTAWRRLEGKIIVGTDPNDNYIKDVGQTLGQRGMTTLAGAVRPHVYPLYTTNIFERYNPDEQIVTVWRVTANKTLINEGSNVRFTITANNLPDGQILKWTVKEGILNSGSNDIPKTDKSQSGSVILKNGSAIVDFVTTPNNNEIDPLRHVRLTVGAPADLSMNVPIKDAGKNETIVHITESTTAGIALDEYYKQQIGSYPLATDTVRFIVDDGVDVIAANTSTPAVIDGTRWPLGSKIVVENRGRILGRGGDGGRSAYQFKFWTDDSSQILTPSKGRMRLPAAGGNGGTAIKSLTRAIQVENYATIAGGGGGGGGLGAYMPANSSGAVGGGGTGGGAPFGKRSPNEGTYSMYLQDDTVTDLKLPLPNPAAVDNRVYGALSQRASYSLANYSGSSRDYRYPSQFTASSPNETRKISVEFKPTSRNYATGDFKTYSVEVNYGAGGIVMNMSQDATLNAAGSGGSNISASPTVNDYIVNKVSYTDDGKGIVADTRGGNGGAFGENGEHGVFVQTYKFTYRGRTVEPTVIDDMEWSISSAKGGLAGYIKEGAVTIKNLSSGITKGR